MQKINSAVLILNNHKYLNKFLNYFKKFNLENILILSLKKKVHFNNQKINCIKLKKNEFNIFSIVEIIKNQIDTNFFLFNSKYFVNLNLFELEKNFYNTNKNIIYNIKNTTKNNIPPFSIINIKKINKLENSLLYINHKNQNIVSKLKNFINLETSKKKQIMDYFIEKDKKTIFLDRDGVINKDKGYVGFVKDFVWITGAKKAIKYLVKKKYNIFVISNQSGVARGYFTEKDVEILHNFILNELKKQNCYINEIFYSPYHLNASIKKFKKNSNCRKPGIKFYKIIRKKWDIKHKNIYMIGDKKSDLNFAKNCGIKGLLFKENNLFTFIKKFV